MESTVKFLSFVILSFIVSGTFSFASSRSRSGGEKMSSSGNYNNVSRSGSGGSGNGSYMTEEESEKKTEETENSPFIRSESAIEADNVIGIKIKQNKLTSFSNEKTFYSESVSENNDFADINFFSKNPNLMSVEFNGLTFSSEALENVIKFIGKSEIKNVVFDSCVLEKEEDVQLVADLINKLDLSGVTVKFLKTLKKVKGKEVAESISPESVETITKEIAEKEGLTSLKMIFDYISPEACSNIASIIKKEENLRDVFLGWTEIRNDKDNESYAAISESLTALKNLQTLNLSIVSVPGEAMEELFDSIGALGKLKNLTVFIGNLKDEGNVKTFELAEKLADSIAKLKSLRTLRLENMGLPGHAGQTIFQALTNLQRLEFLNFSGNTLDKEGCTILGESLKEMGSLKTLLLRSCGIESEGFSSLSSGFSAASLVILGLGQNKIGDAISNLQLNDCTCLRGLDLASNEINSEAMMSFVESTVSHESLHVVDFRGNNGTLDRDKVELVKSKNKSTITYLFGQADPVKTGKKK